MLKNWALSSISFRSRNHEVSKNKRGTCLDSNIVTSYLLKQSKMRATVCRNMSVCRSRVYTTVWRKMFSKQNVMGMGEKYIHLSCWWVLKPGVCAWGWKVRAGDGSGWLSRATRCDDGGAALCQRAAPPLQLGRRWLKWLSIFASASLLSHDRVLL